MHLSLLPNLGQCNFPLHGGMNQNTNHTIVSLWKGTNWCQDTKFLLIFGFPFLHWKVLEAAFQVYPLWDYLVVLRRTEFCC